MYIYVCFLLKCKHKQYAIIYIIVAYILVDSLGLVLFGIVMFIINYIYFVSLPPPPPPPEYIAVVHRRYTISNSGKSSKSLGRRVLGGR